MIYNEDRLVGGARRWKRNLICASVLILVWVLTGQVRQGDNIVMLEDGVGEPSSDAPAPTPFVSPAAYLQHMRNTCRARRSFQSVVDTLAKPTLVPEVMCIANGSIFADNTRGEAYGGQEGALFRHVDELLLSIGGERPPPVFHPRFAVVLSALWNSVNFFHMLMDSLVAAMYWLSLQTTMIEGNDILDAVHTGNSTFLYELQQKSLCTTCTEYSRVITRGMRPSLVLDGTDPRAYCFCGGAVFGMNRLTAFSQPRAEGLAAFRQGLNAMYHELPYGKLPKPEHFTRLGYWDNASLYDAPRLLLIKRRRRLFRNTDAVAKVAEQIGFHVVSVYFDELQPSTQFHLSRYAHVLIGIHGMALTFVANMEGSSNRSCSTLIELMHWVNPTKFYIYREMATLGNVHFRQLLPTDVTFGRSVANPSKERVQLQKRNFYYWRLKGFDDQTVTFRDADMKSALEEAYQRYKRCSA